MLTFVDLINIQIQGAFKKYEVLRVRGRLEHAADKKMMNFIENPEKIRRLKKDDTTHRQQVKINEFDRKSTKIAKCKNSADVHRSKK